MTSKEELRKRREELIKEYLAISKKLSRKKAFTKEEALNNIYVVKPISNFKSAKKLQARLTLPISLAGIKVKLVEVTE